MILITSAAGKTGLAVIRALATKGAETRALVHSQAQVDALRKAGAKECVVGDLVDPKTWTKAMRGVDGVYLICPNMLQNENEIGKMAVAAAREAGLDRFVYHSVLFPQIEAMPHHWQKLRVEEMLIQSRLDFTILQPASYMQNILGYWDVIKTLGTYRLPYSPESRFSPVDLEDVGEAAAEVLLAKRHTGAVYQLAGPQVLSSVQMAKVASELLRRPVTASRMPIEEWKNTNNGLPANIQDSLLAMFEYYDNHDFFSQSTALENLLGRPPVTFANFLFRLPT